MIRNVVKNAPKLARVASSRAFSSTGSVGSKVCVIGAAGGIGQPMSLIL